MSPLCKRHIYVSESIIRTQSLVRQSGYKLKEIENKMNPAMEELKITDRKNTGAEHYLLQLNPETMTTTEARGTCRFSRLSCPYGAEEDRL